ncbi:hypothetical protein BWI17_08525 [Betaproteobacteria bacterium GR16-43]|nr:hypothetical protein BWI17_08525 [Betaproteobacteria bacterium GR16-43]
MRASRLLPLLLLAAWLPANAAELGRLFHTPEEREKLDRMRRGETERPAVAAPETRTLEPEVTGFVKRSDGRNTVWIDGRPLATSNPKAAPLFDPRIVRDLSPPDLPPSAVKVTPSKAAPTKP